MTVIRPPCLPPPAMPPVCHNIVGRAFTPAGEVCGTRKGTGKACAAPLSRLTPTLPVCGARIALRVLKHTCVLRPLHLLLCFLAVIRSAGGARLRSPLQGRLSGGSSPKAFPVRGGGCAARRRRRGALPVGDGNILQTPAGPCPRIRRGRCSHRPGSPAAAQAPMRRARSPALHCGRERAQQIHVRFPPAPPASRCKHRPLRRGVTLHNRHPPAMPAVPWLRRPFALHCRAGVHARRGGARRGHGRLMQTPSRKACNAAKPD